MLLLILINNKNNIYILKIACNDEVNIKRADSADHHIDV